MDERERPIPLEPTPRAILFDLDDTLCDYAAAREARLRMAFSLDGHGNPAQRDDTDLAAMVAASIEIHPHGVDHFPELFSQFGIHDPEAARTAGRWYRANRFFGLELFASSLHVLRAVRNIKVPGLSGARRPVGIITNGPTDVQREKLDLFALREFIDFVVISEEFGAAKPDGRIFEEALRLAGVAAAEAVFIGDSAEFDMVGAIAAGMSTIWINRTLADWRHNLPCPNRTIRSIADVPALVGSA